MSPLQLAASLLAAALGGAINSIAGGGTLVTFPTIVWLGVPPVVANATSTVALWPGSLGAFWGYREALTGARRWALLFAIPSALGGAAGAVLLLVTSSRAFEHVVPFLVLGATVLFMAQQRVTRLRRAPAHASHGRGAAAGDPRELGDPPVRYLVAQAAVAVYGGYFGAGIGILMLATLGAMGLTNIHQMNGLKNWGAVCVNAVAATLFAVSGIVDWSLALAMAVGGIAGGYAGARLAQRVPQKYVRHAVEAVGLLAFVWLLVRAHA